MTIGMWNGTRDAWASELPDTEIPEKKPLTDGLPLSRDASWYGEDIRTINKCISLIPDGRIQINTSARECVQIPIIDLRSIISLYDRKHNRYLPDIIQNFCSELERLVGEDLAQCKEKWLHTRCGSNRQLDIQLQDLESKQDICNATTAALTHILSEYQKIL